MMWREIEQNPSIYRLVSITTLTCGHEICAVMEMMRSQIPAAEMSFLQKVVGLSLRDRVRARKLGMQLLPVVVQVSEVFQAPGMRPQQRPGTHRTTCWLPSVWEHLWILQESGSHVCDPALDKRQDKWINLDKWALKEKCMQNNPKNLSKHENPQTGTAWCSLYPFLISRQCFHASCYVGMVGDGSTRGQRRV